MAYQPVTQQNVELVRELVDAIARQDVSRLIELTDPEVEWHSLFAALGEGGVYRGQRRDAPIHDGSQ
jgi:ketosteroid isomerase-like protein